MNLDDVRKALRRDLDRLRAPEGYLYAGYPRFHTLFGRDSLMAAWQTLEMDPAIARATLRILAKHQGRRVHPRSEEQPGKILHEYRFDVSSQQELPGWEFPYFGSIDSTPLFILVAHAYARKTGDERLIDELWDNIRAAYRWMSEYGDGDRDGYLEYERMNPSGLLHQGWKDGFNDHLRVTPPVALVEVQGYAIGARRGYAEIARRRGDRDGADRAETAAIRTREALDRDFWMADLQFYALALDGSKRPRTAITSNPGHLLVTDAVAPARVGPLVKRLLQDDMLTPYGLRTHSSSEPDFDPYGYHTGSVWPHDNWVFARGLLAHGFVEEAKRIAHSLLRAYRELGRMPELYAFDGGALVDLSASSRKEWRANPLQAWATGALLSLLSDSRLVPQAGEKDGLSP